MADEQHTEAEALEPQPVSAEPEAAPSADSPVEVPASPSAEAVPAGVVSLAAMESLPPVGKAPTASPLAALQSALAGRAWIVGVVVVLLLLLALFLPPISLGTRLAGGGGYTTLNAETPSLTHPDGLTVQVDPAQASGVRVKLASIPGAEFRAGNVPNDLKAAVTAVGTLLSPKSPYYQIVTRGKVAGPATLEVVIPNDAEPWETLDLYTWDSETQVWRWIPSKLDRGRAMLVASVEALPSSAMVMQSGAVQQALVSETDAALSAEIKDLTEVDLVRMTIGTLGELNGDPSQLPPANASSNPTLVPTVRNWAAGYTPNPGLVIDMLSVDADRANHVQKLAELVKSGGYAGLVVDYRGLPAENRDAYTAFIGALAATLHQNGAWLAVTVDMPQANDSGWETGGYDWQALGAAADQVRVPLPADPQAYATGGQVSALLEWATGQVNRYKLYPIFTTMSVNSEGKQVAWQEVLAPLGNIQPSQPLTGNVTPGTALTFQLGGGVQVQADTATGVTTVAAGDTTLWLGTPQWLRTRLDVTARYHLGGVVLRDLLATGNLPGIMDAVSAYKAQTAAAAFTPPEVVWQVTAPNGQATQVNMPLSQPQFAWTAPELTGTYRVAATVAGLDKGSLDVLVAAPVVSPTTPVTPTGEVAAGGENPGVTGMSANAVETLAAAFVADVTVPDNTHFEKGEKFTKTWRMQNAGNKAWPADTVAVFVSGEQMGATSPVKVGAVEPGKSVDISVEMTAPDKDASFQGQWALQVGGATISGSGMTVLIKVGQEQVAATPAPTTPAPSAGIKGSFELGGHILQGFAYADKMHYSGMNWAKIQVRYRDDPSGMIAAAHANGFKVQLSALGGASQVLGGAAFEDDYSNWVAGMAAAGADAIEVWNEPNLPREWAEGSISPQAYTSLLCKAYAAIKAKNSGTAVISAAPAPTGYFGGCYGHGCDDVPWLQGLYNAGAANCFDYIGAHHNAGATAPSASTGHPADGGDHHHSWYFLPQTQIYYNIFQGKRQLFYTELGYVSPEGYPQIPDTFWWGGNTTVAQQAQWLAEVVQLSAQTGMVRAVIVWNVDATCYGLCGGVGDPQAGYAIIRPGGACPACDSLHALLGTR